MSVNYFSFNGESSLTHGVYVGGQATYNAPQRDVTKISIPGRNGDLIQDNGRYLNVQVPYNIVVMSDFRDKTDAIKAWLLSPVGYARLEDTYHPDTFRMARVSGGIDFETAAYNLTGKTQVIFDCKPQRWLTSGEREWTISESGRGVINNPTQFTAKPIMQIKNPAAGAALEVSSGGKTYTLTCVTAHTGVVTIDSEMMNIYSGATNLNKKFSGDFPLFHPGDCYIIITNATNGKFIPRWWTI